MPPDAAFLLLLEKYDELLALRRLHDAGDAPDPRPRMRALAARFPGALRELDEVPTAELERRRADVSRAAAGDGDAPAWIGVTARYHAGLKRALGERRSRSVPRESGRVSIDVLATLARELRLTRDQVERMVRTARDEVA